MTWTKYQIRQARKIELAPLLSRLGFRLRPLQNGNTLVENYPDLIVKQHYWTWPTKEIHGNAIDFLVLVEKKSFHQAMQILSAHVENEELQVECENTATVATQFKTTTVMGNKYDSCAGFTRK
ncbi:MAG: hypothetical protein PHW12_05360 [Smithella sp.]|nr:hypothetical protein [Smithella sp.]MDD5343834.1 hypothetical protein [Smithella sp.]